MATSTVNQPVFNPADFAQGQSIDNPFLPWKPGTTFVYDTYLPGNVLEQIDTVTVTDKTKKIDGVTCTIVSDNVTDPKTGQFIEKTDDYYAQDRSGNVWYFGESSAEFDNGKVTKAGSWLAGVKGALPGIIQEANPHIGDSYDEENAPNVAHDHGVVTSLKGSASVPFGTFKHDLLVTHETSALEPGAAENKYYAAGVGEVFGVDLVSGEQDRLVSVKTTAGSAVATTNVSQLIQAMAGFGASGGEMDSGLMTMAANDSGLNHVLAAHAHHG